MDGKRAWSLTVTDNVGVASPVSRSLFEEPVSLAGSSEMLTAGPRRRRQWIAVDIGSPRVGCRPPSRTVVVPGDGQLVDLADERRVAAEVAIRVAGS